MTNTPLSPRPLSHLAAERRRVMSAAQLRAHGVSAAEAAAHCRPGGAWQQALPGVYLLHPGPPTSEERLHAALLYADRQPQPSDAMVTGLAALALYRFSAAPPLPSLDRIDVLVPRTRRLRSTGYVRIVRAAQEMPRAVEVTGLPVAPVARALADAVARIDDAPTVRRLLTEAVRDGHCEPTAVVRELNRLRLLTRPHVVDAVDALLAEGRALAEDRLYRMVRAHGLPEPLWNVDLRLPGGPHLGGVDAYWPDQAVAVELDTRSPRHDDDATWSEYTRKREHLERLGITVVHLTPRKLRDCLEQQAVVVRTALMAAGDRAPAAYVVVLPR
ncbi:hypothetical protein [Streptomyces lavendofoliae]|uniref:Transcriptional regulator, AbiEi antitoxin, Type IV TA system n=1 Tax=Streptomyces lavendofoliae TaxID=67314 RepID=A0A918M571_9ACTN|nr:hypothetical protein [Streptomyces lavendofoliae]GGU41662.1 hypothetical protein GCM10010274_31860 [Streptomyces lavendofoliae]